MSKELDKTSLLDLLPDSISKDSDVSAAAKALDIPLREMTGVLDLPSIYVSIDSLTSEQLDHLAYSWDASVWRDSWPLERKRSVIKNVIREKRKKGTLNAVKAAVASIGSRTVITEWWQKKPKGPPHTFEIEVDMPIGDFDIEAQEDVFGLIDDAKPVRSHYELLLNNRLDGKVGFIGAAQYASYLCIREPLLIDASVSGAVELGCVARPTNYSRL